MTENRMKIGVFQGGGSVLGKFSRSEGRPLRTIFAQIDRTVNALQLCHDLIHTKKLCSRLFFN